MTRRQKYARFFYLFLSGLGLGLGFSNLPYQNYKMQVGFSLAYFIILLFLMDILQELRKDKE